jgi:hypothetical protein
LKKEMKVIREKYNLKVQAPEDHINLKVSWNSTSAKTLRGVDEKPLKLQSPKLRYRGFLFYFLLTVPGATVGVQSSGFQGYPENRKLLSGH